MGLDQYLTKKTYVKNWNHMSDDEKHNVSVEGKSAKQIKPERITYIEEEVGYWRKANQIHSWFVQNVQNGNDDCKQYYVDDNKLQELSDNCKAVLAEHSKADTLLPAQGGFFFGGIDYDEWYFKQLEQTVEIIDSILAEMKENDTYYEFYYQSSW
jgi:hypothetical protein